MLHYLIRGLGWLIGFRFAPDNHVVPILRLGRFHRVRGPGFFWIVPLLDQTLPAINTGMSVEKYMFDEVVSQDNIPFSFHLTVLYAFNPRLAPPATAAQLVHLPKEKLESVLRSIVHDYASEGLRPLASTFEAEELRNKWTRLAITRNLTHHLRTHLRGLGLTIPIEGVLLRKIAADAKFKRTMLDAEQHKAILASLEPYYQRQEPDLIDKAVEAEFLDSLEERRGRLDIGAYLDLDYLHPLWHVRHELEQEKKP